MASDVEQDGLVYATVFGQLLEAAPGHLDLEYSREPWCQAAWTVLPSS